MSFPKSKTKRFNEIAGCAPPVGSYDPNFENETCKGPTSFDKSDRFKPPKADISVSQSSTVLLATPKKLFNASICSNDSIKRSAKKSAVSSIANNSKINGLETEMKALLSEKSLLLKDLSQKKNEYAKIESKLQTATREKTYLNANIASLVKELKSLRKKNEILVTKLSVLKNNDTKLNEFSKEFESLKEELVHNKHEIIELNEELKATKNEINQKDEEICRKEKELEYIQSNWESLKLKMDASNDLIEELTANNVLLNEQLSDLCDELDAMEIRIQELQDFNSKLQTDKKIMSEDLDNTREKHATEIHDFLTKLAHFDDENRLLQTNYDELKIKSDLNLKEQELLQQDKACSLKLQEYKNSLEKRVQSQKETIEDLQSQLDRNSMMIKRLKEDIVILERALNEKDQLLFESNAEIAELVEKIALLKRNESNFNNTIEDLIKRCSELEDMLEFERNTNKENESNLKAKLDLAKVNAEDSSSEITKLKKLNLDLISELNQEKDLKEASTQEKESLKKLIAEKEALINIKVKDFNELWKISQQKDGDLEEFSRDKEIFMEEVKALKQELINCDQKLNQNIQEVMTLQNQLKSKDVQCDNLIENTQKLKVLVEEFDSNKIRWEEDLLQMCDKLRNCLKKYVDCDEFKFNANQNIDEMINFIDSKLSMMNSRVCEILDEKSEKLKESDTKIVEIREASSELQEKYERQKSEIMELREENVERDSKLAEARKLVNILKEENGKLVSTLKCQDFSSICMELTDVIEHVQKESENIHEDFERLKESIAHAKTREVELLDEIEKMKLTPKIDQNEFEIVQSKLMSVENEIRDKELLHRNEMTALECKHSNKISDYENTIDELKEKLEHHSAKENEAERWKNMYTELNNKIMPFKEQLDMYSMEKDQLLSENSETKNDLVALSNNYAKLLGHQNQKQKIKHVMKLKQENLNLKHELGKTKELCVRQKRQLNSIEERFVNGDVKRRSNSVLGKENFPKPLSQTENVRRGLNRSSKSNSYSDVSLTKKSSETESRVAKNYGLL